MGRILGMVRKDLLRQIRSPMAILFVLAFPVVFTTMLALAFGSGSSPAMPRVQLLIEDLDDSLLSQALLSVTASEQMAQYFDVRKVGPEGLQAIEQNEASALWRIPQNLQNDLLNRKPVEFELIRNPAQSIMPEIAEQGLTVLAEVLSAAARVLEQPLSEVRSMLELNDDEQPSTSQVAALAVSIYQIVDRSEEILNPPVIKLVSVDLADEDGEAPSSGNPSSLVFLLVLPGISVWGLFLVGDIAMRDIITEGRLGTLRRQLCGPIPASHVIVGKALFTATLSSISLVILALIGLVVARRLVDPAGFVLLSAALILAITGFSAALYGGVRTERQGGTLASVLMLVFAFLGGSFFPVDNLPPAVQRLAPLSPFYWGTAGYRTLIEGGGVSEVLVHTGVLAALGAVLLALGSWLLRRKVRGGAA